MSRACANYCGDGWLAGNTNVRVQCTEISIPKRDRHTYKTTDAKRHVKQDE